MVKYTRVSYKFMAKSMMGEEREIVVREWNLEGLSICVTKWVWG